MINKHATAYWPVAWVEDFEQQNKMLEQSGAELLHAAEYLKCRYDDRAEVAEQEEVDREQRHHEVFLKMIELTFAVGIKQFEPERWAELRPAAVESCRNVADLAYPKPERKAGRKHNEYPYKSLPLGTHVRLTADHSDDGAAIGDTGTVIEVFDGSGSVKVEWDEDRGGGWNVLPIRDLIELRP